MYLVPTLLAILAIITVDGHTTIQGTHKTVLIDNIQLYQPNLILHESTLIYKYTFLFYKKLESCHSTKSFLIGLYTCPKIGGGCNCNLLKI